jgi:hypothetical protein
VITAALILAMLAADAGSGSLPPNCPEPAIDRVLDEMPADTTEVIALKSEIQSPRILERVPPRHLGHTGEVTLRGTTDIDGNVRALSLVECKPTKSGQALQGKKREKRCKQFVKAAEEAVSQWKFQPAMKGGKPVCLKAVFTVRFK